MRKRSSWLSVAVWFPLCGLVAMAPPSAARALRAPAELAELEEADRKALETIAGHTEPMRDAVLRASLHVDALVETQRIQEQSSASFQERIGKLDKKQQEQVWNLVREPGLLDELATEKPLSRSQLDAIAKRHPESLAPAIRTFGAKQHDLLTDVARIHRRANERFDAAISDLDGDTQQAFRELVDQPELLSVLVRRVNLVVRLGDSYRESPDATRRYLSALAQDVAKRNAAAEKEWKERIENDPKAAAELEESARAYAEENGYDYDELTRPEVRSRVVVVVNPYPFWFGYPIWYSDLYLYPYGWWYPYPPYFGYYRHHHHYVWWGLPSFSFMHWFYFGHHHHHYTYLSHCFTRYYRDYHYAPTYYNVTVNNFVRYSDPVDHHRGDWSWGRGDRTRGDYRGRYADRDRGFLFNRHRPEDRFQEVGGRRIAPGERGPVIDESRGRSERTTGRERGRDALGSVIQPQNDRGAARGRGQERVEQRSGRGEQRSFQRSDPQPQREAAPSEPRSRDRGQRGGWSRRENGVEVIRPPIEQPAPGDFGRGNRGGRSHREDAPQVNREEPGPRIEQSAPGGGGDRGRGFGGGDAPSVRSDGGGSRGHGWGGSGDGGGRGHGSSGGGDGGGSRGHGGWGGGGSDQGGGGGSRGDFGGGGHSGGHGRGR